MTKLLAALIFLVALLFFDHLAADLPVLRESAGSSSKVVGSRVFRERDRALRTFVGFDGLAEGWTPEANFGLAEGRKRPLSACRELRDDLRVHLQDRPTGRAVMALSHTPSQTPPPAPVETFARYHQGSRLHPRTAQEGRRQNRGRPLGG